MKGPAVLADLQLALVFLHLNSFTLALESSSVRGCTRLSETPSLQTSPHRRALSELLPQASDNPAQTARLLTLAGEHQHWQLYFRGEVEFIEVAGDCLYALPTLIQARSHWPCLQALVEHRGALYPVLDSRALADQLSVGVTS